MTFYDPLNARDTLIRWVDHPQLLWDVIYETLVEGVDLVIHGAGIQDSRPFDTKSLHDFRRVVSTKVDGLANLRRACERHFPAAPIHYHLVTSTFSVLGNDGQADYGVVPIENSVAGIVPETLDMFPTTSLKICAETYIPIHHHLVTTCTSLDQINDVMDLIHQSFEKYREED